VCYLYREVKLLFGNHKNVALDSKNEVRGFLVDSFDLELEIVIDCKLMLLPVEIWLE
jgi:hypothetical protein